MSSDANRGVLYVYFFFSLVEIVSLVFTHSYTMLAPQSLTRAVKCVVGRLCSVKTVSGTDIADSRLMLQQLAL